MREATSICQGLCPIRGARGPSTSRTPPPRAGRLQVSSLISMSSASVAVTFQMPGVRQSPCSLEETQSGAHPSTLPGPTPQAPRQAPHSLPPRGGHAQSPPPPPRRRLCPGSQQARPARAEALVPVIPKADSTPTRGLGPRQASCFRGQLGQSQHPFPAHAMLANWAGLNQNRPLCSPTENLRSLTCPP